MDIKENKENATETERRVVFEIERIKQSKLRLFPEFAWAREITSIKELFANPKIPKPLLCGNDNGVSTRLDKYITKERIKALGNAVVPQVAEVIGEIIIELEKKGEQNEQNKERHECGKRI